MEQDRISQVRQRAHAIWVEQGQPDGAADQHWAQAEAEFDAAEASATITPESANAPVAEPEAPVEPAPLAEPEIAATPEPVAAAAPAPAKKPVKRKVKPLTPIR